MIRQGESYVNPDGTLTTAGFFAFDALARQVAALEAKLEAASAVADAAGGAMVDAEARAELVAIKAALG